MQLNMFSNTEENKKKWMQSFAIGLIFVLFFEIIILFQKIIIHQLKLHDSYVINILIFSFISGLVTLIISRIVLNLFSNTDDNKKKWKQSFKFGLISILFIPIIVNFVIYIFDDIFNSNSKELFYLLIGLLIIGMSRIVLY